MKSNEYTDDYGDYGSPPHPTAHVDYEDHPDYGDHSDYSHVDHGSHVDHVSNSDHGSQIDHDHDPHAFDYWDHVDQDEQTGHASPPVHHLDYDADHDAPKDHAAYADYPPDIGHYSYDSGLVGVDVDTGHLTYNGHLLPDHYDASMEWASFIFVIFVLIVALVGAISAIILMSSVKYRARSYSVFLRFLVVVDFLCVFLLFLVHLDDWLTAVTGRDTMFVNRHISTCILLDHLLLTANITSYWILLAMLVDSYVAVVVPSQRKNWAKKSRAVIVSVVVILAAFGLVVVLLTTNIRNVVAAYKQHGRCDMDVSLLSMSFENVLKIVFGLVVPLPAVLVVSVKTIRARKSIRDASEGSETAGTESTVEHIRRAALCVGVLGIVATVTMTPMLVIEIGAAVLDLEYQDKSSKDHQVFDHHPPNSHVGMGDGVHTFHNRSGTLHNRTHYFHDEFYETYGHTEEILLRVFGFLCLLNYCGKFFVVMATDGTCRRDFADLCRPFLTRRHARFENDDTISTRGMLVSSNGIDACADDNSSPVDAIGPDGEFSDTFNDTTFI